MNTSRPTRSCAPTGPPSGNSGALAGSIAVAVGADTRVAVALGIATGVLTAVALIAFSVRVFQGFSRSMVARFPAPDAALPQPPGRRNT